MSSVSKVLRFADRGDGRRGYMHWCPACDGAHFICTEGAAPNWTFDGNVDAPTFAPSVKITGGANGSDHVCHYHIEAGIIRFCSDSTHALAGQNVDMPPHELG